MQLVVTLYIYIIFSNTHNYMQLALVILASKYFHRQQSWQLMGKLQFYKETKMIV